MKNMMLPARSFSMLLLAATLCFAACKKDKNDPEQPQPEQQTQPQQTETLAGNVARPSWSVPTKYDYSSSMTAVIKVDLKAQYADLAADFVLNANDMLAAFSGETCLGIAKYEEGLFFLYIASPVTGNPSSVTLRYYSANYKNLFEAKDAFTFANDANLGTTAEPFKPAFVVAK